MCLRVCGCVCVCVWYEKGGLETLLYLSSIIIHGLVVTNIQPFRCSRGGLVGSSSKPSWSLRQSMEKWCLYSQHPCHSWNQLSHQKVHMVYHTEHKGVMLCRIPCRGKCVRSLNILLPLSECALATAMLLIKLLSMKIKLSSDILFNLKNGPVHGDFYQLFHSVADWSRSGKLITICQSPSKTWNLEHGSMPFVLPTSE